MKTVIIEDEAAASRRLKKMILELNPETQIVYESDSVESSVKWLTGHPLRT